MTNLLTSLFKQSPPAPAVEPAAPPPADDPRDRTIAKLEADLADLTLRYLTFGVPGEYAAKMTSPAGAPAAGLTPALESAEVSAGAGGSRAKRPADARFTPAEANSLRSLLDTLSEYAKRLREFSPPSPDGHEWARRVLPAARKLAQHMSQKLESRLADDTRVELELRLADFEAALELAEEWVR